VIVSPAANTRLAAVVVLLAVGCGDEADATDVKPSDASTGMNGGRDAADDPPPNPSGYDGPMFLSETGLYGSGAGGALAEGVESYRPHAVQWKDGADSQHWVWLPEGTKIDTADMDRWVYPAGTKLWEEISVGGQRIETRMLEKLGDDDWLMIAFIWNAQDTDAEAAPLGQLDASGTTHDVPYPGDCQQCHDGIADRVLGFSALQLSGDAEGLNLTKLIADDLLTAPPAAPLELPGDETAQAALGYLHGNCGHCHNPDRQGADLQISVYLWQEVASLDTVEDTVGYRSLVTDRTIPAWVDAMVWRMDERENLGVMMPPLGSKRVDANGLAAVKAWTDRLATEFPPAPAPAGPATCTTGLDEVFRIFDEQGCRTSFCHGATQGELGFMTAQALHDVVVGVDAAGSACAESGLRRVEPGDPDRSLLMIKLGAGPPCGKIMPPGAKLSADDIQVVADWITACEPQ